MRSAVKIAAWFTTLSLLCGTQPALATGWSAELTVTRVFTEDSDDIVIYTTGGSTYTPGCTANSWVISATSDARRGRMYAAVLSALAAGKQIQIFYMDTCGSYSFHKAFAIALLQ